MLVENGFWFARSLICVIFLVLLILLMTQRLSSLFPHHRGVHSGLAHLLSLWKDTSLNLPSLNFGQNEHFTILRGLAGFGLRRYTPGQVWGVCPKECNWGTIPWLGPGLDKRERKRKTPRASSHLVLLHDCGCNGTSCFMLLLPGFSLHSRLYLQTGSPSKPVIPLLNCCLFFLLVRHLVTAIKKLTNQK